MRRILLPGLCLRIQILTLLMSVGFLALLTPTIAQSQEASNATNQSPLQQAFHDDFRADTRGDYETEENVTWESGKLRLSAGGSSLERLRQDRGRRLK